VSRPCFKGAVLWPWEITSKAVHGDTVRTL